MRRALTSPKRRFTARAVAAESFERIERIVAEALVKSEAELAELGATRLAMDDEIKSISYQLDGHQPFAQDSKVAELHKLIAGAEKEILGTKTALEQARHRGPTQLLSLTPGPSGTSGDAAGKCGPGRCAPA